MMSSISTTLLTLDLLRHSKPSRYLIIRPIGTFGSCIIITKENKKTDATKAVSFVSKTFASTTTTLAKQNYYHNKNVFSKTFAFVDKNSAIHHHLRYSTSSSDSPSSGGNNEGEAKIKSILKNSFPNAREIIVQDISGGCGSMYQVYVEADDFKGLSIVKQHQLVNKVLSQEIKAMHGIRIQTEVPLPQNSKS